MRELDKLDAFVAENADKSTEAAMSIEAMIKAIYDFVVGSANPDNEEKEEVEVKEEVEEKESEDE
jgi:hypothetical protein